MKAFGKSVIVASSRGRELKLFKQLARYAADVVASSRGRELKLDLRVHSHQRGMVASSRGRELKLPIHHALILQRSRLLTGA